MPRQIQITLNTARLDSLTGSLAERAMTILDKIAFDVLRNAQPRTAVDTGAMRSSGYVSGASGGSTFSSGASEAQSRRPKAKILDEVTPKKQFERIVGFSVNYAYWQELSQPYLTPAVEEERPKAEAAWAELFR